jgi:hypothetical protein
VNTFNVPSRVNLLALGLAFVTMAMLVSGGGFPFLK